MHDEFRESTTVISSVYSLLDFGITREWQGGGHTSFLYTNFYKIIRKYKRKEILGGVREGPLSKQPFYDIEDSITKIYLTKKKLCR